jgi:hypothetical protein
MIDQQSRTISVSLMPQEALQIARIHKYGGHDDPHGAAQFPIDEIVITGTSGGLKFSGGQARKAFSEVSRALYTLSYK